MKRNEMKRNAHSQTKHEKTDTIKSLQERGERMLFIQTLEIH